MSSSMVIKVSSQAQYDEYKHTYLDASLSLCSVTNHALDSIKERDNQYTNSTQQNKQTIHSKISSETSTTTHPKQASAPQKEHQCPDTAAYSKTQPLECYTCARVSHHYNRVSSILKEIDNLFGTTADVSYASLPTHQSYPGNKIDTLEYSHVQRFLLEGYDEQSSICALGGGIGELNISPPF